MREVKPNVLSEQEIIESLTKVTTEEIKQARKSILTSPTDIVLFEGAPGGATVKDINGREFLDCTSMAWTLNVGFCYPDVMFAAMEQLKRLSHSRHIYLTIPKIKLANKLTSIAPGDLKRVGFNNQGGSLAIETALKVAMVNRPKASTFITAWEGYHGDTLATMSATHNLSQPLIRFRGFGTEKFFKVPFPYCYRCAFGEEYPGCGLECANFLRQAIERGIVGPVATVLIEPMQGPGGQIPAPPEYMKELRKICDDNNVLLTFDEIQTAFGRVGKMFAAEYYGVVPDIMALAKALGGGLPIGATLVRKDLGGLFGEAEDHSTFKSSPVSFAAALINLEVIERLNLPKRSEEMGRYITKGLNELKEKYEIIGDVRGPGLFIGVELVKNRKTKEPATVEANKFTEEGLKRNVIFGLNMPDIADGRISMRNVVKVKPPLTVTKEQADHILTVFDECLGAVTKK